MHKCPQCHKMFSATKYLNLHILTKHTQQQQTQQQQQQQTQQQQQASTPLNNHKSESIKIEDNDAENGGSSACDTITSNIGYSTSNTTTTTTTSANKHCNNLPFSPTTSTTQHHSTNNNGNNNNNNNNHSTATLLASKSSRMQADAGAHIKQEGDIKPNTMDLIRQLISKSQQLSCYNAVIPTSFGSPSSTTIPPCNTAQYAGVKRMLLPTPSAVSVLSVESLTRGYKRNSTSGLESETTPFNHSPVNMPLTPTLVSQNNNNATYNLVNNSNNFCHNTTNTVLITSQYDGTPLNNGNNNGSNAPKMNISFINSISSLKNPALIASQPQKTSKAKGILYKNVYMQCEGTYYCSVCKADLSSRESKRSHRQLSCGDPKTVTYSRKYFYLCPYCSEKFPSQKECRQHQVRCSVIKCFLISN